MCYAMAMDQTALPASGLEDVPVLTRFEGVADIAAYRPLPDDWVLATADIVGSTQAIADGRYKAVNMAGASVISALLNGLGRRDLPFVFGGDGALVALPGALAETATGILSAVQAWVADELGLTMRAAIVPLADIKESGFDVRVARFQASDEVTYAMFAGGGASWAEAEMKAGRYRIEPAPAGTRPDLTGLSCRWNPIQSRRGEIVSIIAVPTGPDSLPAFQALVGDIIALAAEAERGGHPVPLDGPEYSFPPPGLAMEAAAVAPPGKRLWPRLSILAQMVIVLISDRLHVKPFGFDAEVYKRDTAQNSDFRKFDDGLKMTLDVDASVLERIRSRLAAAERDGVARFGLHRQDSALMTCLVASPMQRNHVHFIDGAAGGYAMAAAALKAKAS